MRTCLSLQAVGRVEDERRGGQVVLGVCQSETETGKQDARTGTKTGGVGRACRLHFVGFPEVVTQGQIHVVGRQEIHARCQMVHEHLACRQLFARCEIVILVPSCQVHEGDGHAEWGVVESFRKTDLHGEGQLFVNFAECFYLSAQVARYGRQREIRVLVVVIYAQVYGQCYRRIVAVFRIDELACGTTGPPVVQVVGIHAAQSHVHGRERAHGDVVGRDFVHGAVVGILRRDAHCGTFSQYLDKRRTPHVTPLQVSHEIEIQRLVAHGTEQCGVAEDERRVVLYQGDIASAQSRGMCGHRHFQEVEHGVAFLGMRRGGKQDI